MGPVKSSLGTHQLAPDVSLVGHGRVSIRQLPVAKLAPYSRHAQKVPKLTPCAHGEVIDHTGVGDEHIKTHCMARNKFKLPRRATLHCTTAPIVVHGLSVVGKGVVVGAVHRCGNAMPCCCNIVAT